MDGSKNLKAYLDTDHLGPNVCTNAIEEADSTPTYEPSFLFDKYRQDISKLWVICHQLEILRHILLIFHGINNGKEAGPQSHQVPFWPSCQTLNGNEYTKETLNIWGNLVPGVGEGIPEAVASWGILASNWKWLSGSRER